MKKILTIIVALFMILLYGNISSADNEINNNDYSNIASACSVIDTSKLKEMSEKYVANENIKVDDTIPTAGSLDYTKFTYKNYYSQAIFGMVNYFENLSKYSPVNNLTTCGYVSLIQVLSYYDTFYNFNIIPNEYNRFNESATNFDEAKAESPGVLQKSYFYYGNGEGHYNFCNTFKDEDLQSCLAVIHNELLGTNNEKDFEFRTAIPYYQNILNRFYGEDNAVKVNDYAGLSQTQYIDLIKESISSGNPVIVHIKTGNQAHSVVAYDYDDTGVYAHFGLGNKSNRCLLLGGDYGYNEIYRAATLDFSSMGHWHSKNYIINSNGYCGCNISDKLNFTVPIMKTNIPPTFYWMRNSTDPDETYKIEFKSMTFGDVFCSFTTNKNQMTLSVNDWRNILKSSNKNKGCWIEFTRISSKTSYWSSYYEINKPSAAMEHITLSPSEYGFIEEYNVSEISSNIVQGKYNIGTNRLRCGYIENEGIVLSPRRENAGTAYIDYQLNKYIYRIDIDLFLWSEYEYLSTTDSRAYIQYKNSSGDWVTVMDLLSDIELSTDKLFPETYTILFPEKTKEFRIYIETASIGDRNKGRLCIGDLSIYLEG